jgi:hypothetical protein
MRGILTPRCPPTPLIMSRKSRAKAG